MRKEYWINVKHVDNRLVIYLNGSTVWDSGIVHEDPELDEMINITELLKEHPEHTNQLIFEGYNDTYSSSGKDLEYNPWHFHYRVFSRTLDAQGNVVAEEDLLEQYNQKHLSNPNVRAINNKYELVKRVEGFKVISNSISQQFYQ